MVRHHKKTKKHSRRRRHRGGGEWLKPWTWGTQTPAPGQTLELPPVKVPEAAAKAVAPVVDETLGTPKEQASALGVTPASPSAPAGVLGGGRRRGTRKHRRRH